MDLKSARRQIQLWEKTLKWIEENPELYERFVELALEKASRNQEFGISSLTERVRWDYAEWAASRNLKGQRAKFHVPNECRRYIALRMYEDHPHLETYCTTKKTIKLPSSLTGEVHLDPEDVIEDPAVEAFLERPFTDSAIEDLDELFANS